MPVGRFMSVLVSVTKFKEFYDIGEATWDTEIQDVLDRGDDALQETCARSSWSSATHTERYDMVSNRNQSVPILDGFLIHTPITSITSISLITTKTARTVIQDTDYDFDSKTGEVIFFSQPIQPWNTQGEAGRRPVEAIYVGGYDGTVPGDLTQAAIEWAGRRWDERIRRSGVQQESLGGQWTYQSQTPEVFRARLLELLGPHMRAVGI